MGVPRRPFDVASRAPRSASPTAQDTKCTRGESGAEIAEASKTRQQEHPKDCRLPRPARCLSDPPMKRTHSVRHDTETRVAQDALDAILLPPGGFRPLYVLHRLATSRRRASPPGRLHRTSPIARAWKPHRPSAIPPATGVAPPPADPPSCVQNISFNLGALRAVQRGRRQLSCDCRSVGLLPSPRRSPADSCLFPLLPPSVRVVQ